MRASHQSIRHGNKGGEEQQTIVIKKHKIEAASQGSNGPNCTTNNSCAYSPAASVETQWEGSSLYQTAAAAVPSLYPSRVPYTSLNFPTVITFNVPTIKEKGSIKNSSSLNTTTRDY